MLEVMHHWMGQRRVEQQRKETASVAAVQQFLEQHIPWLLDHAPPQFPDHKALAEFSTVQKMKGSQVPEVGVMRRRLLADFTSVSELLPLEYLSWQTPRIYTLWQESKSYPLSVVLSPRLLKDSDGVFLRPPVRIETKILPRMDMSETDIRKYLCLDRFRRVQCQDQGRILSIQDIGATSSQPYEPSYTYLGDHPAQFGTAHVWVRCSQ